MTGLPNLVQRAPVILYGAALLYFVGGSLLTMMEVNETMRFAEAENPMARLATMRGVLQAAESAIYLVANGAMIHLLLAIWRNGAQRSEAAE